MDIESFDIREQMRKYDPYTHSPFESNRDLDRREGRFIDTMMLRMRGKEISYNEASHIIQEMLVHMNPENAHRLVYDMSQRLQLLQDLCHDKSKIDRDRRWEYEMDKILAMDVKIIKKKNEFLTRNDMEIE